MIEDSILSVILVLSTTLMAHLFMKSLYLTGWWLRATYRVNIPSYRRKVYVGLLLISVTGMMTALGVWVNLTRWGWV